MTRYDPDLHHRRSIRLPGYDYRSAGVYYVTLCVWGKLCLLGEISEGEMMLSTLGCVVDECWTAIPDHFPRVVLDEYVIMPNHMHGIIIIHDVATVGARHAVPLQHTHQNPPESFGKPNPGSLATIIRSFKSAAAKRINHIRQTPGARFWQRNFYEHIIRDQERCDQIRSYILSNPANWAKDDEYMP